MIDFILYGIRRCEEKQHADHKQLYTVYLNPKPLIAVALGYFDGLHLGHQKIIECTDIPNHKRGILTFTNQPAGFITHSRKPSRLLSLDDKVEMMEKMGTVVFIFI